VYVQVITFSLDGIDEQDYLDTANRLAARIADLPGLLAKIWLENEAGNRYGGVYFWDDLESMERFSRSDLFEGHVPEFTAVAVEEFGVLENLTGLTQPVLEILESRGAAPAPTAAVTAPRAPATTAPSRKRTPPPRSSATPKAAPARAKGKGKAAPKKASAPKTSKSAAR
jgi:heme-degrading monooxygenase HmoA